MMRSFYAGVAGLRNHQIRMDVIGNNIANVNTIGFKASRVTFADMLYQTLGGSSAPEGGLGGTNPRQVGLGVSVGSIDTIFTQGNIESTGRTTDLAIEGEGFFVLTGGNAERYVTRAGAFTLDEEGYLVNPAGYRLMGWQAVNGVINTDSDVPGIIQIRKGEEIPPGATTACEWGGNLDSRSAVGDTRVTSQQIYDSQGNLHELTVTFQKAGVNTWTWTATCSSGVLTIEDSAGNPQPSGSVNFNLDGSFASADNFTINITGIPGVQDIVITPDFSKLTQYANVSSANIEVQNGYPRGSLTSIDIDSRGVITGLYSNGRHRKLAQVAIGNFANVEGLTRVGQSMFMESNNSGELVIDQALTGGRGVIKAGSVEMSNVDLSQQFTDMIITQRGFQANSRVITTSDEMLQELVNLKR
ncbi:MAG: flagellar hook protein FlgE [Firmicutes bacterium]|nr:flagellar hook protein FlgE [Bacillota bacterium]